MIAGIGSATACRRVFIPCVIGRVREDGMSRRIVALCNGLSATGAICSGVIAFVCPALAQAPTSYYGTIAVSPFSSSDSEIHWGAASWLPSQPEADQAALKQCHDSGGRACKIEAQGTGTHLALWFSTPDKAWGVERGASPEQATGMALAACLRKVANLTNCTFPTDGTSSSEPGRAASIDPRVVGSWEIPVNFGHWFLEVDPLGTYKFHSDAGDGAPTTSGSFATNGGYWSLQATTGYTDAGTYYIQPPDTFVATSQRLIGKGSWRHPVGAAPPLDGNGQRLYARLVTEPPGADLWSLAGTALIKATGSITPPVGQAVVTYELQPLATGLPTNVVFRIFATSEAAATYVDDKEPVANYLTGLPAPGVIHFGQISQIKPFDHPPRIASTMQSEEQRAWLRLAYEEGRVVILVDTGEAKPNVKDNDAISNDLLQKGVKLLQLGEIWLKEKSAQ